MSGDIQICNAVRLMHWCVLSESVLCAYSDLQLTAYMIAKTTASSAVKNVHLAVLCCEGSKLAASSPARGPEDEASSTSVLCDRHVCLLWSHVCLFRAELPHAAKGASRLKDRRAFEAL